MHLRPVKTRGADGQEGGRKGRREKRGRDRGEKREGREGERRRGGERGREKGEEEGRKRAPVPPPQINYGDLLTPNCMLISSTFELGPLKGTLS